MMPDPATWVGRTLDDRWRVLDKLGEGGMAYVFLAEDLLQGMMVVLKAPKPKALQKDELIARFRHEIATLRQLVHPHIVKILDCTEHEGVPLAVLPYLSGGSLSSRQPRSRHGRPRPVDPGQLAVWLPAVAGALDYLHQQDYLHRDVKPGNILFDAANRPFLIDFGLHKVTAERRQGGHQAVQTKLGQLVGTAQCMAPELILARACDGRLDQYALAVTVFQQLTGRYPFDDAKGRKNVIVAMQVAQAPPSPSSLVPAVPEALSEAVLRGLAKGPQQRFPTCAAFAEACLRGLAAVPARPVAAPRRDANWKAEPPARRNPISPKP
jgi:serine/threonine protein kinase